jgi:hypothetical protein
MRDQLKYLKYEQNPRETFVSSDRENPVAESSGEARTLRVAYHNKNHKIKHFTLDQYDASNTNNKITGSAAAKIL